MRRPTELQISLALDVLNAEANDDQRRALAVVRRALAPRPVWPAKEVAEALSTKDRPFDSANLKSLRGLPKPAQVFDRPTSLYPKKKMNLYYADEIEVFAARYLAERGGS